MEGSLQVETAARSSQKSVIPEDVDTVHLARKALVHCFKPTNAKFVNDVVSHSCGHRHTPNL